MNTADEATLVLLKYVLSGASVVMIALLGAAVKWLRSISQSIEDLRVEMAKRTAAEDRLIEKVSMVETRQAKTEEDVQTIKERCAAVVAGHGHRRNTDPGDE